MGHRARQDHGVVALHDVQKLSWTLQTALSFNIAKQKSMFSPVTLVLSVDIGVPSITDSITHENSWIALVFVQTHLAH